MTWAQQPTSLQNFHVHIMANNFRIVNNGKEFLTGDESSIKVIYNNLAGKNIYGVLYYMYLKSCESKGLRSGTISLFNGDVCIESATIKIQ